MQRIMVIDQDHDWYGRVCRIKDIKRSGIARVRTCGSDETKELYTDQFINFDSEVAHDYD